MACRYPGRNRSSRFHWLQIDEPAGLPRSGWETDQVSAPPAGTDWAHRMVACDTPPGAGGDPAFSMQNGKADLDLTPEQVAIVFGFRDPDRTMTPGALREETMVNYFAVQTWIAP